jgi:ribosomal protein L37AE/L43A
MPDRDVRTIEDQIFYQYAKIIARSAFAAGDGKEAKARHYGFIKQTFRDLRSGAKSWSEITREDWQFVQSEEKCIYCGAEAALAKEHIVPRSIRINERCPSCDKVQGIHNQIWACKACNSVKGSRGLYSFYKLKYKGEKKFYDLIPPLVEKKYLKTIYNCHNCSGTLGKGDLDGDGEITVLDIDFVMG